MITAHDSKISDNYEGDDNEDCAATACKHPQIDQIDWIQCDGCDCWYHFVCVRVKKRRADTMLTYCCPPCRIRNDGKIGKSYWRKPTDGPDAALLQMMLIKWIHLLIWSSWAGIG